MTSNRRQLPIVFLILCIAIIFSSFTPLLSANDNVIGNWKLNMNRGDRSMPIQISIKQNEAGQLTGTLKSAKGNRPLQNIRFANGILQFEDLRERNGFTTKNSFHGTIVNDQIEGTIKNHRGNTSISGQRSMVDPDALRAILGEWEMTMTFGDRDFEALIIIRLNNENELVGMWETERGNQNLSDVSFEDGVLRFARVRERNGETRRSLFEGKIENKELKGTLSSRRGTLDAIGHKIQNFEDNEMDELAGKWLVEMHIEEENETFAFVMSIEEEDGKFDVYWDSEAFGKSKINKMSFDGSKFEFTRRENDGEESFEISLIGEYKDEQLIGVVEGPWGTFNAKGTRMEDDDEMEFGEEDENDPVVQLIRKVKSGELSGEQAWDQWYQLMDEIKQAPEAQEDEETMNLVNSTFEMSEAIKKKDLTKEQAWDNLLKILAVLREGDEEEVKNERFSELRPAGEETIQKSAIGTWDIYIENTTGGIDQKTLTIRKDLTATLTTQAGESQEVKIQIESSSFVFNFKMKDNAGVEHSVEFVARMKGSDFFTGEHETPDRFNFEFEGIKRENNSG